MFGDARLFTDQLADVPFSTFFPHDVSAATSGIDFFSAHCLSLGVCSHSTPYIVKVNTQNPEKIQQSPPLGGLT
jgi:hypothetical protein